MSVPGAPFDAATNGHRADLPSLTVTTETIADPGSLFGRLAQHHPLLWLRRGEGMVGFGEALRLEFDGPTRFADAAEAWRTVSDRAAVSDAIAQRGTGLVALGTFAFSSHSATRSVLIVPSIILGRRDGLAWLTRVNGQSALYEGQSSRDGTARPGSTERPSNAVHFEPGAQPPDAYRDAVAAAVQHISSGRLSKVVLARDLVGSASPELDLAEVLTTLATGYPDCWTFAIDGFFGSSPETLVSVRDGVVSARVLAGSAARGTDVTSDHDAAVALVTSSKDQDEHEYAVQSVLAALRSHSRAMLASEVPYALKLPNLWHLASDVAGPLDDHSSSLDLVAALHPTAAVAGTPTVEAMTVIDELEPFDRGRYAGPVGWIGANGDGEWAIALRCAQEEEGSIRAFAGAGIVAESIPEHELAETTMKFRPIIEAFG